MNTIVIVLFLAFFLKKTFSNVQEFYLYKDLLNNANNSLLHDEPIPTSMWIFISCVSIVVLFLLLILGFLKALVGLYCWPAVGMWGLGKLIDLPQPLRQYQEYELQHRYVRYNEAGWPVHPDTGKRSVRAITVKTEFYLNMIFFVVYPLIVIIGICSLCYSDKDQGPEAYYKCENTIVINKWEQLKLCKVDSDYDIDNIYADDDPTEDKDTEYVVQQMHHSKLSLQDEH